MKKISLEEIHKNVRNKVSVQSYAKKEMIKGLEIVQINRFVGEDGTFEELCRIDENGALEAFPKFKPRQMSRSKLLPGAIKAWHLHFSQEDVWYVPPEDHVLVGLWDLRESSPTRGKQMRVIMGAGYSKLLYIPRGVAHGVANISPREATVVYYVNQQFDLKNPDERRLPWDAAGAEFWTPERG